MPDPDEEKLYQQLPEQPDRVMEGLNLNKPLFIPNFYENFLLHAVNADSRNKVKNVAQAALRTHYIKFKPTSRTIHAPKISKLEKAKKSRERRRKALSLPSESLKYTDMLELHNIWLGYMRELISSHTKEGRLINSEFLLRADLHGARLRVTASVCPNYVNTEGIVIFETQRLFKILDSDNRLKAIPKKGSEFSTQIDSLRIRIIGTNFLVRPADRVKYKFKGSRCTTEL